VILVIAVLAFRSSTEGRDYVHVLVCASNVKALGAAIGRFAEEHDGKLPEKLEDLSHYYSSEKILFCPSRKAQTRYSYMLTGATVTWRITNVVILVEIEPNHYGKRHVLFDDGRVELQKE
jgi:hypothetical protein